MTVYNKIKELGGDVPTSGINWQWTAFPTEDAAKQFIEWLDANGGEHRGIYHDEGEPKFSVRFR
jgi:hypothetical protein